MSEKIEPALTPEQKARDMLERMGVEDAQSFSAGEVVELANLIAAAGSFTWDDVDMLRREADRSEYAYRTGDNSGYGEDPPELRDLADRIAARLPPREP